ncbi:SOS response-associated peptidase family protein [Arthrobacter sp. MSA 4-2]|uniref:SOS response-associated peptidase family protein n=1 Tax=Arthrobacter sp. MSA 4-2 TaxID=2794349 RepID=UPI0027DE4E4A|nr:SOS response-associated peptidase family protein [Arthrobacter sp. MSA 4-2]
MYEQLCEGELVRRLEVARWGLVPVWSKDSNAGAKMINAGSGTVTEKLSFRTAADYCCARSANGYHEWQKNEYGVEDPVLPSRPGGGRGPVAGSSPARTSSGPTLRRIRIRIRGW